jgi:hypothetical protein
MGNSEIKLTLTVDQVNGILQSLGNMPFVQVVDLIALIRNQAASQVPVQSAPQTVEIMDN